MRFAILGPLEVRSDAGESIPVGGPKSRALLTVLLLNAGQVVGLDRLVTDSTNAVQAQASRLRRSLTADLIEFTGGGYRIAVDPEDVDVHRFERLARDGRHLLAAGAHARAAAVLREALALWRGPALVDLSDAEAQVVKLEEVRLTATEDLVEAELALPEGTSVGDLRRLVGEHPFRERLRGQLMRALHASGRTAEALAEYDEVRRLLTDELGADPSAGLAEVHLAILRAERPPALPARQMLAAQLTSIVGRERELTRLAELGEARLVTVTGPGGIGKTRLAIEAVGRAPRDVCFVDLSRLVDGAQVPHALLGALGLREPGFPVAAAADPVHRLVGALRGQNLTLVLDNCEQVVDAVAGLVRTLLAECPELTVLATSREPLGLTGETLVPLEPLATPSPGRPASDAPAVRLFVDRAAAVRPGFALGPDNVGAVVSICRLLDGLPLAIELAAARLRHLGVDEIAARLAEHGHFRLLSRGDRTAAERHQTLRAVIEWSWNLLRPEEQVLARRFAVFTNGATLGAVQAVCGIGDADEVLADLVDRSLVGVRGGRYQMLDTIFLYCRDRLVEAGEEAGLRRSHARYHLALAQRADPHLRRAEQLDWLAMLSAEHENLMAALRWAVHHDRGTAFRLVAALAAYWWLSGRHTEVAELAAELLDNVPEGLEEEYVSCVVHAESRAAAEHRRRADRVMRTLERPLRHPFGAAVWGMMTSTADRGAGSPSPRLLGDDPWNVALQRLGNALLAMLGGRVGEGERALADVLTRFRAVGERWGTAQALDWLAYVAGWRGEWTRAHELWTEALDALTQLGAGQEAADVLCRRADCLVRQGELDAAGTDYRRAEELSAHAGRPDAATVELGLGKVARLRGDMGEACRRLDRALAFARIGDLGTLYTRTKILTELARLAEATGRADEARRRYREALEAARAVPLASNLAETVEGHAGAALLDNDAKRSALLLGVAVALRGTAVAGDADVTRTAAAARALIGAEVFADAYARGAAMTHEQALTVVDTELAGLSADRS